MFTIKLYNNNKKFFFHCTCKSLLDALIKENIKTEFQCCSGYCGVCHIKLINGMIKYHYRPLAYIRDGEILPCCCIPIKNIELKL